MLSSLPPRLRYGGYFSGWQRQDSLRVPIETNELYFIGFSLGMDQYDSA